MSEKKKFQPFLEEVQSSLEVLGIKCWYVSHGILADPYYTVAGTERGSPYYLPIWLKASDSEFEAHIDLSLSAISGPLTPISPTLIEITRQKHHTEYTLQKADLELPFNDPKTIAENLYCAVKYFSGMLKQIEEADKRIDALIKKTIKKA